MSVQEQPEWLRDQLLAQGQDALRVAHYLLDLEARPSTEHTEEMAELIGQMSIATHALMTATELAEDLGLPSYNNTQADQLAETTAAASPAVYTEPEPVPPVEGEQPPAEPEQPRGLSPLAKAVLGYVVEKPYFRYEKFRQGVECLEALGGEELSRSTFRAALQELSDFADRQKVEATWQTRGKARGTEYYLTNAEAIDMEFIPEPTTDKPRNEQIIDIEAAIFAQQLADNLRDFVEVSGGIRRSQAAVENFVASGLGISVEDACATVNVLADAKFLFKEDKDHVKSVTFRDPAANGHSPNGERGHKNEIRFTEHELGITAYVFDALSQVDFERGESVQKIFANLPDELRVESYYMSQLHYTIDKLSRIGLVRAGRSQSPKLDRSGKCVWFKSRAIKTDWQRHPGETLTDLRTRFTV